MKKFVNGEYIEVTEKEISLAKIAQAKWEQEQWEHLSYEEAVDMEIRKRYTVSQEFAILRQKEEKPDEYAVYYAYCEDCKAYVKEKKGVSA